MLLASRSGVITSYPGFKFEHGFVQVEWTALAADVRGQAIADVRAVASGGQGAPRPSEPWGQRGCRRWPASSRSSQAPKAARRDGLRPDGVFDAHARPAWTKPYAP